MPAFRFRILLLVCIMLLGIAACAPPLPFSRFAGLITDEELNEISGLAASYRHPDILWVMNDGGNSAHVYAINRRGQRIARYATDGVRNVDWEDLTSFELNGKSYLLIADTGDNGGLRKRIALHIFEEPEQLHDGHITPAWSIQARWPDGPRDCEAVAVDAQQGTVYLISKKRSPPELFSLPLQPAQKGVQEARRLGRLTGVPQVSDELKRENPKLAALFSQVTAADISPDRSTLAVLTYGSVLFYRRAPTESWVDAVTHPPEAHPIPMLPQAEALAWNPASTGLYATGEFHPAPLFYLVPQPQN